MVGGVASETKPVGGRSAFRQSTMSWPSSRAGRTCRASRSRERATTCQSFRRSGSSIIGAQYTTRCARVLYRACCICCELALPRAPPISVILRRCRSFSGPKRGSPMPIVAPAAEWSTLVARLKSEAPEAFASEDRILNLIEGDWKEPGFGRHYESAVDGRSLGKIPMISLDTAKGAVKFARSEFGSWSAVDLDERKRRVTACLEGLRKHRELIALLLIWEIGKPYAQALTDIDRCISGVEWYVA